MEEESLKIYLFTTSWSVAASSSSWRLDQHQCSAKPPQTVWGTLKKSLKVSCWACAWKNLSQATSAAPQPRARFPLPSVLVLNTHRRGKKAKKSTLN